MPSAILNGDGRDERLGFRVSDMAVGDRAWLKANDDVGKRWYDSLLARAERIVEHRFDFFDLKNKHLGDLIYRHYHHKRRQAVGHILTHLLAKRVICRLKKFVVNKH